MLHFILGALIFLYLSCFVTLFMLFKNRDKHYRESYERRIRTTSFKTQNKNNHGKTKEKSIYGCNA